MQQILLRRKFISLKVYIKKRKVSQINNLNFHLRKLEKEE